MRTVGMRPADAALLIASLAAAAGFVLAHGLGWAADWAPYPSLTLPSIDPRVCVICLPLFAPVVLWRSRS